MHHGNSTHGIAKPIRENLIGLLRLLTDSQNKISAAINNVDMVRYLVEECGMDIQDQDDDGDTPLDYALMNENTAVEEYIESAGALRNRR